MTRVCVSTSNERFLNAVTPVLQARGLEVAPLQEGEAADVVILADLVPVLMVQAQVLTPSSAGIAEPDLLALETRIAAITAARVVFVGASLPDGASAAVLPPVAAASQRIEAALATHCGPRTVILRVSDILDPQDPGFQQVVRAQIDGKYTDWPQTDRVQPISLTDLASAVAAAAQVPGVLGKWYDVGVPEAIDRYTFSAEAQRLARLLSDPNQTEIQERPPYPPSEPMRDCSAAVSVLHSTPRQSAWVLLAQTVKTVIRQSVDSGAIAPITPPMPAVFRALETGALPLAGRRYVVTGATAGIGRAATLILLRLGASVTGVGRNAEAGAALLAEVEAQRDGLTRLQQIFAAAHAQRSGQPVEAGDLGQFRFEQADLSDPEALRALAARLCADLPRIDGLFNCAGAAFAERRETPAGIEATLAINLVAPVTLTRLLAAPLTAAGRAGGARVINLVSDAHFDAPVDLNDLQARMSFVPADVLARSKSGLVMMTAALAELMQGTGVSAVAVSPGAVRTDFLTVLEEPLTGGPTQRQRQQTQRQQARNQMQSPNFAAAHVVDVLVSPEFAALNGGFVQVDKIVPAADHTQDRTTSETLWQAIATLGGLSA